MSQLRAAIVGLGAISFEHVAKLQRLPGVAIVGVCDVVETVARAVAERFDVGPPFTSLERMLSDARPDVVHVLTPPQTHRDIVLRVLDAGAHVLVEKPIAPTWAEYVEMRDAARDRGLLLVEDYNWRFLPVVERALEAWRSGEVGDVVAVEVNFGGVMGNSGPLRDRDIVNFAHALPGGALHNFVTHPVSLALPFMDEVTDVSVWQRKLDPASLSDDELHALIGGRRSCGVIAVTSQAKPPAFTLTVQGTGGGIEVDLYNGRFYLDRAGSSTVKITNALRHGVNYVAGSAGLVGRSLTARQDHFEGLARLLEQFYRAVRAGGPPPVTVAEMDAVNGVVHRLLTTDQRL